MHIAYSVMCVIGKKTVLPGLVLDLEDYVLDDFHTEHSHINWASCMQVHPNPYPVFPTSSTGSSNCKALCSSTAIFSNSGIHTRWLNPLGGDCLRSRRVWLLVRLPSPPSWPNRTKGFIALLKCFWITSWITSSSNRVRSLPPSSINPDESIEVWWEWYISKSP